jgi:poly(3-hydroxybutyrate) depolymerase
MTLPRGDNMRIIKMVVAAAAILIAGNAFAQRGTGQQGGIIGNGGLPPIGSTPNRGGGQGGRGPNSGRNAGNSYQERMQQRIPPEVAALRARIQQRTYEFKPTGEQISYSLFLPRQYKKTKAMPLVIALHGAGVSPDSIANGFASAADKYGYIIAAPMGYNVRGWYGVKGPTDAETASRSEQDVMNVLDMVREEFNIDPRRIYIAGHSMGGIGAVHIAAMHPDIFAAVGAMSPGFTRPALQQKEFTDFDAAPVIVLAGDNDELIPIDLVRGWVANLKQREVPTRYYEYTGGNHAATLVGGPGQVFEFFRKYCRREDVPKAANDCASR